MWFSEFGGEPPRPSILDGDTDRQRREHGDRHAAANRHLFNKLLGQLYHCLQHGYEFDEVKAFARTDQAAA